MATIETLLTAEDYAAMPDPGVPTELVRGRLMMMSVPAARHGVVCYRTAFRVGGFVEPRELGWVLTNDAGILTSRNPDTVRGADVAYCSFARLPAGTMPTGYLPVAPEVVFEVLSPSDLWSDLLEKIAEYLAAGVLAVVAIDPVHRTAHVYRNDQPPEVCGDDDDLRLPEIHPEFKLVLATLFD